MGVFSDYVYEGTYGNTPEESLQDNATEYQGFFGDSFTGTLTDMGKGAVHGVLGFGESVIDLGADALNAGSSVFDYMTGSSTDWDIQAPDLNGFIEPSTGVGQMVSGLSQFATGFALTAGAGSALGLAARAKQAGTLARWGYYKTVDGIAGALSYQEREERLSNLLVDLGDTVPGLNNPITRYLAADEDDGWLEGRMKNALEGFALGAAFDVLAIPLRALKASRKAGTKEAAEAILKMSDEELKPVYEALGEDPQNFLKQGEDVKRLGETFIERQDIEPVLDRLTTAIKDGPQSIDDSLDDFGLNLGKFHVEDDVISAIQDLSEQLKPRLSEIGAGIGETQKLQFVYDAADTLGRDPKRLLRDLAKRSEGDIAENLPVEFVSSRMMLASLSNELKNLGILISKHGTDGVPPQMLTRFMDTQTKLEQVFEHMAGIQRGAARTIRAAREPITASLDPRELMRLKSEFGGDKGILELAQMVASTPHTKGVVKVAKNKHTLLDAVNSWRINAMLSGPKTHIINALSNTIKTITLPAQNAVGSLARLDMRGLRESAGMYLGISQSFKESFGAALNAFRTGHSTIDALTKFDVGQSPINARTFRADGTVFEGLFDMIGKITSVPSRGLQASDEFFKQMNYRAYTYQHAYMQGLDKGLKGKELSGFITETFEEAFESSGKGKLSEALAYAHEATFTRPLKGKFSQNIQQMVQQVPLMRMIMPFVSTPINIMSDVAQHAPGLGVLTRNFRDDFAAGGIARNVAIGKQLTGAGIFLSAGLLAAEGRITGGGPEDPDLVALKKATGWQPHSIVVDNEDGSKSYYSYNRLEPVGMMMGMVADLVDIMGEIPSDEEWTSIAMAGAQSIAANVTSKTYLRGVAEFMEFVSNPKRHGETYGRNFLGSFMPSLTASLNTDDTLRVSESIWDGVRRKVPGYSSTLAPRRNIFGEKIIVPGNTFYRNLSPFAFSKSLDSKAAEELASLGHGFQMPSPRRLGVNLEDIPSSDGSTHAYDQFLQQMGSIKLQGKTLKQNLERLVKSKQYQALPDASQGDPEARVRVVNRYLSAYRGAAQRALLRDNEAFREAVIQERSK